MRLHPDEVDSQGALHIKFVRWIGKGVPEGAWTEIMEDDKLV